MTLIWCESDLYDLNFVQLRLLNRCTFIPSFTCSSLPLPLSALLELIEEIISQAVD